MRITNYYKANSLEEAYNLLISNPNSAIIAGGLWMKKVNQNYDALIDLSGCNLNKIEDLGTSIKVGAYVTLSEFESNLLIRKLSNGVVSNAVRQIMGPAFRNLATVGGSVYGRYPFSDLICILLPYEVKLNFYPEESMSLEEYLNYKGKVNKILTSIEINKCEGKAYFKKVRTTELDFPLINFAIVSRNNKNYIVVGSRPGSPTLAKEAMKLADSNDYEGAAIAAVNELSFMDSSNISKEYRQDLTKVYVKRGLEEVNR